MPPPSLDDALTAWRQHPDPSISAAVRALSDAALDDFDAPRARSRDAFHAAWMAVARDDPSPVATGWLASTLDRLVPIGSDRFGLIRPGWMLDKHKAPHDRVAQLRARCPDPRIADAVLAVLEEGTYGFWDVPSVEQIYRPFVDLLLAAGDPAAAERLRPIATSPRSKRATVRDWAQQALPDVVSRLEDLAAEPLPADLARRWAALGPEPDAPEPTRRPVEALLQEVYAEPADDGVRQVLADALADTDDPRGELLALQLGRVPPDDGRVDQLVREHHRTWLGDDLADTLVHVVFRRGFADEASLRTNASASQAVWEAAAADPRLATIRTLHLGKGNRRNYERFLLSGHARDLRDIELPTTGILDSVAAAAVRPLHTLALPKEPRRAVLKKLAASPAFATVDTLRMDAPVQVERLVGELVATGMSERIAGLCFVLSREGSDGSVWHRLAALRERLPHLVRVEVRFGTGGAAATLDPDRGWVLTLDRCEPYGMLVVPDLVRTAGWGALPARPPGLAAVRAVGLSAPALAQLEDHWGCTVEPG